LERKRQLAKPLGKVKHSILFNEHLAHDGAAVFDHARRTGLQGIVSKRLWSRYGPLLLTQ
jgi:ATP-dependent DNA ligase